MNFLHEIVRRMPPFKGKYRLVKALFGNHIRHSVDEIIKGRNGCTYVVPNLKENVSFEIFCNGIYEPETIAFLTKIIPANGVFLDLGANIGSITFPLLRRRPDIQCFCVEASPWVFDYLAKNKTLNGDNDKITLINKALFDKDELLLPFYSPKEKYGKGSLSPVFTQEAVTVQSIKIDSVVRHFKIETLHTIKIDIEGFEYFAFRGADELLTKGAAPDILFEFVDWAEEKAGLDPGMAQQFLISKGYNLYKLSGDRLSRLHQVLTTGSTLLFASKKQHMFA